MEKIFAALASTARRKILAYLSTGDLTAGEIAERFSMSKPAISKHLQILENAGLVEGRKDGQFIHYSLVRKHLANTLNGYLQEVCPVSRPLKRETPQDLRPIRRTIMRDEMLRLQDATRGPFKVHSLTISPDTDPLTATIYWDAGRSLWNGGMMMATLFLAPLFFSWSAFGIFMLLLLVTMCTGHSVGFHRRLIHRTFQCSKTVERILVWSGVLVGMQGPFWVMRAHDIRDWAQRQPDCHLFLKHGGGMLRDGWWNLHCGLCLAKPPAFDPGPGIGDDPFYRFLQRTWMLQQLPLAVVLFALGGWSWVVWGICVRVTVGVTSHWFVGYICHTHGPQNWLVDDGAVQAHDVPWAAILSMGESWHNNHHAFPASARHGILPGQLDIGFHFVKLLEWFRLAWQIQTPDNLPHRPGIMPITPQAAALVGRAAVMRCA